jgi:hypothetical protein
MTISRPFAGTPISPKWSPADMSPRSLLIVGVAAGILVGVALFALVLAVVAIDGAAMNGQMMAMLILGAMLGFVLDATWLTFAVDRISKLGRDSDDDEGDDGWGKPGPDPVRPRPPSEDPDWWPAFERGFRVYDDTREHAPTAD